MKKIAFISITMNIMEPLSNCIKRFPQISPFHYVDAGISEKIAKSGHVTDTCMERMIAMIAHACQDEADGIVLTCTMFSAYVPDFRKLFSVPIVAADVAMMEQAAESDGKKLFFVLLKEPESRQRCFWRLAVKNPARSMQSTHIYCQMRMKRLRREIWLNIIEAFVKK